MRITAWLLEGFTFAMGDEPSPNDTYRFGVFIGCSMAIAMTGSIIPQNVTGTLSLGANNH